jgi:hypothetical protein
LYIEFVEDPDTFEAPLNRTKQDLRSSVGVGGNGSDRKTLRAKAENAEVRWIIASECKDFSGKSAVVLVVGGQIEVGDVI